ncbi:MAG TPA: NFACT RNA binding domain-containing protein [Acetivibrio sp.]|uniref:Rqc2 family fibronectin-binding protein n=1 Tax=Acetivibrio sp. TaxID=1872092 RepID=UPI002C6EA5E1|nr:NFACT RNA binding domain-containing protein [Acetivibrio sp.]HOM02126.1 NFACT RNA binding domain-containing protein [Acetivibrio sp.]
MPFDGIVTKNVVNELTDVLTGARIDKIYQPEQDEIIINLRAKGQNLKLLLSANASYPRIHFTDVTKENPVNPPVFCMLLRKHLSGGRITQIEFHDFERVVTIHIETINELGDLTLKKLVVEIMGKHSNIILVNNENKIIDSIKHVDSDISRVREVMPARPYTLPPSQDKTSPLALNVDLLFTKANEQGDLRISKFLLNNIKGFSPLLCEEICHRAGVDPRMSVSSLSENIVLNLKQVLKELIFRIEHSEFTPCIIWNGDDRQKPVDFHSFEISQYNTLDFYPSISKVLDLFYTARDTSDRLTQKKADLLKILNNCIDRCNKKISIHTDTLREVAEREKFKLYGELITANIYCIPKNADKVSLLNYYSEDGEYVEVPLDENLLPQENAQRYFKKYAKAKAAYIHTTQQLEEARGELSYLESVLHCLESSNSIKDIDDIRQELADQGYLPSKKKKSEKKNSKAFTPYIYKSTDGLYIYVGKNNVQNDFLTLRFSSSNDIWLHTKNIPGSHVIIKKEKGEIPDSTLFEAAQLAAYHSKAKNSSHVEVDYTQVRNVKKPNGAKPGMVIYDNYKTIIVTPDENIVNNLRMEK